MHRLSIVLLISACNQAGTLGHGGHRDPADTDTPPGAPDPTSRVLVLDVDGLHASDLERFVTEHPDSALAGLAATGVRYTHASASRPSDSFPGVLALFTGGTPASTGVYYDVSYDRTLSPPGSDCSTTGTEVDFSDAADVNPDALDGGGGLDPNRLPRSSSDGCAAVYPHQYLRVNTAFEVVKAEGRGRTAWSDKHLSYDILQGPSGTGVDDLYDPEISSGGATDSVAAIEAYDDRKVEAVLAEIQGFDHSGAVRADIPVLFGMNFQAVSVEQKGVGYADAQGVPTDGLAEALAHTDASIGRIVDGLEAAGIADATTIVVTAPHGNSPIDPNALRMVDDAVLRDIVNGVQPGLLAQFTGDDVGLIWLTDPSRTADVRAALEAGRNAAGIATVLSGADLTALYPDPAGDARTPDLIVEVTPGVIYAGSVKHAEHGGFGLDDLSVALLVANTGATGVRDDVVETRQVAPTVLARLGIDPTRLDAVVAEGTPGLPGL